MWKHDVCSKLDAVVKSDRNYRKGVSSEKNNQLFGHTERKQKVQTLQNSQDWKIQVFLSPTSKS